MNSKPLLGLCPIGKFVFSHEDAIKQKNILQVKLKLWDVRFIDLDTVLPDGLVRDQRHVDAAVKHFQQAGVDCLFLPHCNFGTEGAAAMIAHKLDVPVLLWGPRDEAPLADGRRLRDSLCGMFATSKVLRKLGVVFSYIENCSPDDLKLKEGLDTFLRAANVANIFRKGTRIGMLGQRIDFFWTTIINESELLEKFNIEILPLDLVTFINNVKRRVKENRNQYDKEAEALHKSAIIEHFDTNAPLWNIFAMRDEMFALANEHKLEGFATQDFASLVDAMGAYDSYSLSMVAEQYAIGCETDIHGCISDIIMRRVMFNESSAWLTDATVRHPDDDNGVLLWHAGAPVSMKHPDEKVRLGKHWILPSPLAGMTHFRLKDGPITVCRFDGDGGEYQLAVGQGESMDGPKTLNNYVWMKVNNWPSWEHTIMEGPFIHHLAMAYGQYAEAIAQAARFIPYMTGFVQLHDCI